MHVSDGAASALCWLYSLFVQEEYSNEQELWKAQLDVYLQKLHVEAHERTAAVALAAAEQQELEQKLWEVRCGQPCWERVMSCCQKLWCCCALFRQCASCRAEGLAQMHQQQPEGSKSFDSISSRLWCNHLHAPW